MKRKIAFLLFFILLLNPFFVLAEQIDINSAILSQLEDIVHVGEKIAPRIIDGRPYSSVSDLSRVKGIGDGKYLQDIINQGWACVNCTTQTTQQPAEISAENSGGQAYSSGVFINEVLPNPEGPDETDEWIELYNFNNSDVDLSDWQIQDIVGTTTTFIIPKDTKILANGFLVLKRPDTKIMLNNDTDGLNLLTPDNKVADSINFISAPLGQSYNKVNSHWVFSTTLTPGDANIITVIATKTSDENLSKTKNSVNNNAVAAISETINPVRNEISNGASPWFLFFTALAITIILATIVLLIKFRIHQQ